MIPSEVIRKIRRIQITTSRMVTDVFAGQYQSVFKGHGMEFAEVREYQAGDDIRSIDWNVTARTGRPFVKKFVEERELTVIFLLDMSASSLFGSVGKLKSSIAAELTSVLAFAAIKNNDKTGLIAFSDRIEKFVPPAKGTTHVLRIVREALYHKPVGRGTDIPAVLRYLSRTVRRRAVVFVISDFYADDYEGPLRIANRRHDIVAITLTDPREIELPDVGIIHIDDAETGEDYWIDSSDRAVRQRYSSEAARLFEERKRIFRSAGVDHIDIRTDVPYTRELYRFFRMRERRI